MLLRILTFFKWVYGNPLTFLVGIRRIPAYHVDYTTVWNQINEKQMFFFFFTSLRAEMPNRSIAKAMLEDRPLQYNIFTNIMTRMLSHVKKYIAYK